MSIFDKVVDYFASNTFVVAKDSNIATNPLEKSIENLESRYSLGNTNVGDYIKFGYGDDFPILLQRMYNQSPVHAGIVTKKAKMVAGNGLLYNVDAAFKAPVK